METTNDIVREIRKLAKELQGNSISNAYELLMGLADRIEATHKREKEDAIAATVVAAAKSASEVYEPHIQSAPVSNAAAMRQAVIKILGIADHLQTRYVLTNLMTKEILELKQIADAALSAPPRNCDLYKSEPEAYQAYRTAMKNATKKTYVYFEPWLFAEAKGETKK